MSVVSSNRAFFGRAYQLEVQDESGNSLLFGTTAWMPESLRIRFSVEQLAMKAYWFADIEIYNMDPVTEQMVIKQGHTVNISAGYQASFSPSSNLLFSGTVFQPLWERVNVTDYKLTLRCMLSLVTDAQNFVAFATSAFSTQNDIVARMAKEARTPFQIEQVDEDVLSQKQLPRGKVVFGSPGTHLAQMAHDNGLAMWTSPNGINIRTLENTAAEPAITYAPMPMPGSAAVQSSGSLTQTLIGTPQQTQEGVAFRVLMDSRLKIGSLVKLDHSVIRQMQRQIGQYPSMLDQDSLYVVAGIRHEGDTWGEEWFSEVTGLTRSFWQTYTAVTQ